MMSRPVARWLSAALAASGLAGAGARADVRLPAVIGDNMVVQRETDVPIWGWAAPGEAVSVKASWGGPALTAQPDASGKWRVKLRTPAAGGPHTITISGKNSITINNVLSGEVWLASGQSNMEWPMSLTNDAQKEIAASDHPEIRLFNVTNAVSVLPKDNCEGRWLPCSPTSVPDFSAAAYFFGRALQEDLKVPIGLLEADWGGTPAEAWTSGDTLKDWPEYAKVLEVAEIERREPGAAEKKRIAETKGWWNSLAANEPADWRKPEFNDSSWSQAAVPGEWSSISDLKSHDGIAYFRHAVEIPAAWVGKELRVELGPIDDMDTTWVNGERVGGIEESGFWNRPREYKVPASVVKSTSLLIAVRVLDAQGLGGMTGRADQLRVRPAADNQAAPVSIAGNWRYRVGPPMSALPPFPPNVMFNAGTATSLYNGMIAPLEPYGMRGVIWYQGEANRGESKQYQRLFPALIADWRKHWGQGDFPWYFVQIAPFRYGGDAGESALLREAQFMTLKVPNTGMVVTTDIGNVNDIHPTNKQEVGRRLALWALAKTYGRKELEYSGPLYKSMTVEGAKIRVKFEHAEGLMARGGPVSHLQIAGEDRKFVPAMAEIDGSDLIVSAKEVPQPKAVRFGWSTDAEPNLFNKADLPASPFRTDEW